MFRGHQKHPSSPPAMPRAEHQDFGGQSQCGSLRSCRKHSGMELVWWPLCQQNTKDETLTEINPTKDGQDPYTGNCKMLLKPKMQVNGELDCVRGSEDNIVKMLINPPNWSIDPMQSQSKSQQGLLKKLQSWFQNLCGNSKDPEKSKQLW